MKMNDQKLMLMKDGHIPNVLLKLGLPAIIGLLVSALYNVVDAYFVGGLGTSQMAAVSVAFPLGQMIIGLGMTFGSGAASCLARLLGAEKRDEANRVASTALFTSLLVGAVMIAISLFLLDPLLAALGATATILPHAHTYAFIYLAGSIFNIFNVTVNHTITAEGASKITMLAMASGGILNVILDPIFIYTLDMGIAGAAVATVLSQAVSTAVYLWFVLGKKGVLRFRICSFTPRKSVYAEIFKIGIPGLVFQLLASLALSLTNTAAGGYGDAAVAAMGVVTRIMSLGTYILFGFMRGFQPLAGYNYGAGRIDRLNETVKVAKRWVFLFCGISALLLVLFAPTILSAFSKNDAAVVAIGALALRANAVLFIFCGYQLVYGCLYMAMGRAKEGIVVSIGRQGLFFVPIILLLPRFAGLNGVLFAQPLADLLTVALTFILTIPVNRELSGRQAAIGM